MYCRVYLYCCCNFFFFITIIIIYSYLLSVCVIILCTRRKVACLAEYNIYMRRNLLRVGGSVYTHILLLYASNNNYITIYNMQCAYIISSMSRAAAEMSKYNNTLYYIHTRESIYEPDTFRTDNMLRFRDSNNDNIACCLLGNDCDEMFASFMHNVAIGERNTD